jgi:hypothetical protein
MVWSLDHSALTRYTPSVAYDQIAQLQQTALQLGFDEGEASEPAR